MLHEFLCHQLMVDRQDASHSGRTKRRAPGKLLVHPSRNILDDAVKAGLSLWRLAHLTPAMIPFADVPSTAELQFSRYAIGLVDRAHLAYRAIQHRIDDWVLLRTPAKVVA